MWNEYKQSYKAFVKGKIKVPKKLKRKIIESLDITKPERCPFCDSIEIGRNPTTNYWICNSCGNLWEDSYE